MFIKIFCIIAKIKQLYPLPGEQRLKVMRDLCKIY